MTAGAFANSDPPASIPLISRFFSSAANLKTTRGLKAGHPVPVAIANDPDLTESQKQTLHQIYETFRRENVRDRDKSVDTDSAVLPSEPVPTPAKRARKKEQ